MKSISYICNLINNKNIMTTNKYEGWIGSYVDAYFNNWEKGKWIKISYIKYLYLNMSGFKVRINKQII